MPSSRRCRPARRSPVSRNIFAFSHSFNRSCGRNRHSAAGTLRRPSRACGFVPSMRAASSRHVFGVVFQAAPRGDSPRSSLAASTNKPAMNTDFRDLAVLAGGGLERLSRRVRETLRFRQSFQSARPISGRPCARAAPVCSGSCASDARKAAVRCWRVIEDDRFVEDAPVAGLLR